MSKQKTALAESPRATSQPQHSGALPSPAAALSQHRKSEPTLEYCALQISRFMPIKVPEGWTQEKDIAGFVDIWGEKDDYRKATFDLLEDKFDRLNAVLEAGIMFLAEKEGVRPVLPPSTISTREKVALFAQLLPAAAGEDYVRRFSLSLARILWLEAERERIGRYPEPNQWLFPFYEVADSFLGEAFELEESLRCEHNDFSAATIREVEREDR